LNHPGEKIMRNGAGTKKKANRRKDGRKRSEERESREGREGGTRRGGGRRGRRERIPFGSFVPHPQHKLFWSAGFPRGVSWKSSCLLGGAHSCTLFLNDGQEGRKRKRKVSGKGGKRAVGG
jgi:hypothetical protein